MFEKMKCKKCKKPMLNERLINKRNNKEKINDINIIIIK